MLWRRQRRLHTYFGLYTRAMEESCLLHRCSCVRWGEKKREKGEKEGKGRVGGISCGRRIKVLGGT